MYQNSIPFISSKQRTSSMGRGISTLVVTVQGNVQPQVLGQILVVAITKHVGVVTWESKD